MDLRKTIRLALLSTTFLISTATIAQAKPSVAVLGLEVVDDGGGLDAKTAKLATDLTNSLRKRASVGAGPFRLAPNSKKDLLEMKLLNSCANEARSCMAAIGKELKADRLIYGKIERRKNGYQVTLKLLDVTTKKMERSTTELIQLDDTDKAAVNKWSRRLYNRLTGVPDQGSLKVKTNAQAGTVFINGDVKGTLAGGTVQISGLPEGNHEIRIEAEGYEPFSGEVTISGGSAEEIDVTLTPKGSIGPEKPKKPKKPGSLERKLFWTTAVLTAAGATAFTITGLNVRSLEDDKLVEIERVNPTLSTPLDDVDACEDAEARNIASVLDICKKGQSRATITNVLIGTTVLTAAAAGYFYYKGYVKAGKSKSTESASKQSSDETVVKITPAVSPNYVGAGIQIEF